MFSQEFIIFCHLIIAKVIVFVNNLYTYISEEITALSDSFVGLYVCIHAIYEIFEEKYVIRDSCFLCTFAPSYKKTKSIWMKLE